MATNVKPIIDHQIASNDDSVLVASWSTLTASGDLGLPICLAAWSDKTVVVTGDFTGSPTIIIEGSNDGTNFVQISNRQGTAMSFTAAGLNTSQDRPVFVRPRLTAGAGGGNVVVSIACHRTDLAGMGR